MLVGKHARQTVPRCFGHFLSGEPRLTKYPEALLVTPWSLASLSSGPTSFQHRPPSSHEQITLETVAFAGGSSSLHPVACQFPPSASRLLVLPVTYRPTLFCALRDTAHVHRRAWPKIICRVTTRPGPAIYAFSSSDTSNYDPHHGVTGIHISPAPDLCNIAPRSAAFIGRPCTQDTCLSTLNINKPHAGRPFHPDRRHNLDPGGVSVTPGFGGAALNLDAV